MNDWVSDIQAIIYTRIKAVCNAKFKTKYPKINYTISPVDTTKTAFPTIYIHRIAVAEKGLKLERNIIDEIYYVCQIEVFSNDSNKTLADEISNVIVDVMKTMNFDIDSFPIPEYATDYTRCVMRCKKFICSNDTL